jgi:hypothetical protein
MRLTQLILMADSRIFNHWWPKFVCAGFRAVAQLQFEMVCERPPAAFGGSPPHGGCPSNAKRTGVGQEQS